MISIVIACTTFSKPSNAGKQIKLKFLQILDYFDFTFPYFRFLVSQNPNLDYQIYTFKTVEGIGAAIRDLMFLYSLQKIRALLGAVQCLVDCISYYSSIYSTCIYAYIFAQSSLHRLPYNAVYIFGLGGSNTVPFWA